MAIDSLTNKRIRTRLEYSNRILCHKHIITQNNRKPDPKPILISIKDISYSGIGIECDRDLGMGDYLIFNLEAMGITRELMMEVKWCKYNSGDYLAGLQFVNLTKSSVLFLDDLIKSHIKKMARQPV